MTRQEYIEKYKLLATDTTNGTGLFPSVMLAQALVESGNGNSTLADKYNNHFGIKVSPAWKGSGVNLQTREVVKGNAQMQGANFRVYNNVKDSYLDRIKFLMENKRYRDNGVFDAKTPLEQLKALQKAGYATDPEYAKIINQVLTKYNLEILDVLKKHPVRVGGFILAISLFITGIYLYKTN